MSNTSINSGFYQSNEVSRGAFIQQPEQTAQPSTLRKKSSQVSSMPLKGLLSFSSQPSPEIPIESAPAASTIIKQKLKALALPGAVLGSAAGMTTAIALLTSVNPESSNAIETAGEVLLLVLSSCAGYISGKRLFNPASSAHDDLEMGTVNASS